MSTVLIILAVWFGGSTIVGIMLGRFMARMQTAYPEANAVTREDTQPRPATFPLRRVVDD